jgi:hypothetical protein
MYLLLFIILATVTRGPVPRFKNQPQHIFLMCILLFAACAFGDTLPPSDLLTWVTLKTWTSKWHSLEKRTFLQSSAVQIFYFFIISVKNCFLVGFRAIQPTSRSLQRTVESCMWTPAVAKSFWRWKLALWGWILIFLKKNIIFIACFPFSPASSLPLRWNRTSLNFYLDNLINSSQTDITLLCNFPVRKWSMFMHCYDLTSSSSRCRIHFY